MAGRSEVGVAIARMTPVMTTLPLAPQPSAAKRRRVDSIVFKKIQ